MDIGAAYLLKKALRKQWGEKPCTHSKIEQEIDVRLDVNGWFCLECGRDLYVKELESVRPSVRPSVHRPCRNQACRTKLASP